MITFNASKREKAGKGAARACRREGRVPAVIYGNKQEPVMISLHPVELEKALEKLEKQDYAAAATLLKEALAKDPSNASAYLNLAKAYEGLGQNELAEKFYQAGKIFGK